MLSVTVPISFIRFGDWACAVFLLPIIALNWEVDRDGSFLGSIGRGVSILLLLLILLMGLKLKGVGLVDFAIYCLSIWFRRPILCGTCVVNLPSKLDLNGYKDD